MSRKRPEPAPEIDGLPTTDQWDRMVAALETVAQNSEAITEEIKIIRETIDRLQDDVDWAINNREEFRRAPTPPCTRLTSIPLDPCAADFGERINTAAQPEAVADTPAPVLPAGGGTQRQLWQ